MARKYFNNLQLTLSDLDNWNFFRRNTFKIEELVTGVDLSLSVGSSEVKFINPSSSINVDLPTVGATKGDWFRIINEDTVTNIITVRNNTTPIVDLGNGNDYQAGYFIFNGLEWIFAGKT